MVRSETPVFPEPTRLILTDEGSSYFFARNQRLQKFRLLDGREEYGLQLSEYAPTVLQKLILGGLIRKLEFPIEDIVEARRRVIDYIHILAYGLVYFHGTTVAEEVVERSDLKRGWRRSNPKSDFKASETKKAIETLLSHRGDEFKQIQAILRTRIRTEYAGIARTAGRQIDREDQERINLVVESLLTVIPREAWFLLILNRNTKEGAQLVHDLARSLAEVVEKTSIADYLALMVVELLVHMQHHRGAIQAENGSETVRPTLYLLAQMIHIPRRSGSDRDRYRMHMMVSTGNMRFEALKADLDDLARETGTGAQTFEQFYRSAGSGNEQLGLYYTGFLEDACRRMGVSFDAFVRGDATDGLMNLVLTL
jgi:hypothetical protein